MPSLSEFQQRFGDAVLAGEPAALAGLLREDRIPAAERLAVYRNNVLHNYREALRAVYPVIDRLVGSEFFDAAAREYVRAHPSTSGDLNRYGAAFPAFLAAFAPAAGLPYLRDTARLEWALHEVFHAAERPPLPIERLAALAEDDTPRLRFELNPACRLLASAYPVDRLWALHQRDAEWDESFDIGAGGVELLVFRSGFEAATERLGRGEFALLVALAEGERLGEAFTRALGIAPELDLGGFLQRHILRATFCNLQPG